MCGRFASTATPDELMRRFGVNVLQNLVPRWNVAPSQKSLVIVRNGLHDEAVDASWGLQPAGQGRSFLINARVETVGEKPAFRDAFLYSRCIIPASGWYEWSAPKTPWHVQLSDGGVMAMAGLVIRANDGLRFVVITSAADGGLARLHHRQPLILQTGAEARWLGSAPADAAGLLVPAPANWFNWYRVSPEVGKVAADHPGLVTPFEVNMIPVGPGTQGDLFS